MEAEVKAVAGLALALTFVIAACGNPGGAPAPPNTHLGSSGGARPGNAAIYERIAAETDCGALQAEFDTAEAGPPSDWKVPYMEAAEARMREVGCYD